MSNSSISNLGSLSFVNSKLYGTFRILFSIMFGIFGSLAGLVLSVFSIGINTSGVLSWAVVIAIFVISTAIASVFNSLKTVFSKSGDYSGLGLPGSIFGIVVSMIGVIATGFYFATMLLQQRLEPGFMSPLILICAVGCVGMFTIDLVIAIRRNREEDARLLKLERDK